MHFCCGSLVCLEGAQVCCHCSISSSWTQLTSRMAETHPSYMPLHLHIHDHPHTCHSWACHTGTPWHASNAELCVLMVYFEAQLLLDRWVIQVPDNIPCTQVLLVKGLQI